MLAELAALSLLTTTQDLNLCADARNCREVGVVEIRSGGQTLSAPINDLLPFVAQNGLTLFAGESVVVTVSEAGEVTVESHGPAAEIITPQKLQRAVAEMHAAIAASGQDTSAGTINPVPGDRPVGRLRISLMQAPGSEETVLLVENGYDRQIDYRAFMQVPGRGGPAYTTSCEIIPNLMVLEHWPHPIAVITLNDFRDVASGGSVACD